MKKAILFMGLPASGKTTLIDKLYRKDYNVVSADEIKATLDGYDPSKPDIVHQESVQRAEKEMYRLADEGKDICMDSGGVNNSYSLRIIKNLKDRGYLIKLVYVNTPLSVCLERNKNRERFVPEKEIIEKSAKIESCFLKQRAVSHDVDIVEYFTNKHIFLDMDGVLAEYQTLTPYQHNLDYINSDIFKRSLPVVPVIETIKNKFSTSTFYILSASPNSVCNDDKKEWLKIHTPFIQEKNIFFVGRPDKKVIMLCQLLKKLKISSQDCMYIDDVHKMIQQATEKNINAMHPSKLLARYYQN